MNDYEDEGDFDFEGEEESYQDAAMSEYNRSRGVSAGDRLYG